AASGSASVDGAGVVEAIVGFEGVGENGCPAGRGGGDGGVVVDDGDGKQAGVNNAGIDGVVQKDGEIFRWFGQGIVDNLDGNRFWVGGANVKFECALDAGKVTGGGCAGEGAVRDGGGGSGGLANDDVDGDGAIGLVDG